MPSFSCPFNVTSVCDTFCTFYEPESDNDIEHCVMSRAASGIDRVSHEFSTLADVLQGIVTRLEVIDGQ